MAKYPEQAMIKLTTQQVADMITEALMRREGEVITPKLVEDRANNIAIMLMDTEIK